MWRKVMKQYCNEQWFVEETANLETADFVCHAECRRSAAIASVKRIGQGVCTALWHDWRVQKQPTRESKQRTTTVLHSLHWLQPMTSHTPNVWRTPSLVWLDASEEEPFGPSLQNNATMALPRISEAVGILRLPPRPPGRSYLPPVSVAKPLLPWLKHRRISEEMPQQEWRAADVQAQPPHPGQVKLRKSEKLECWAPIPEVLFKKKWIDVPWRHPKMCQEKILSEWFGCTQIHGMLELRRLNSLELSHSLPV